MSVLFGASVGLAAFIAALKETGWVGGRVLESWFVPLYPYLVEFTHPIVDAVSLSVTELVLVACLISACAFAIRGFRVSRRRGRGRLFAILRATRPVVWLAALAYILFMMQWGWLYTRLPVDERLAFSVAAPKDHEIRELVRTLIEEANATRAKLDPSLGFEEEPLSECVRKTVEDLEGVSVTLPSRVKDVFPSMLLTRFGFTGVTSPWLHEAHVDPALLPVERPFTSAHELAHVAGYARESEASFIAYLACLASDEAIVQYSALLATLMDASRSLPTAERKETLDTLSQDVKDDWNSIVERAKDQRWRSASKVQKKVYDQFLKSQGVASGIRNYSEVIDLIVRHQRR